EGSGVEGQLQAALAAAGRGGSTVDLLARKAGVTPERAAEQVRAWVTARQAIDLRGRVFSANAAETVRDDVLRTLGAYHAAARWVRAAGPGRGPRRRRRPRGGGAHASGAARRRSPHRRRGGDPLPSGGARGDRIARARAHRRTR